MMPSNESKRLKDRRTMMFLMFSVVLVYGFRNNSQMLGNQLPCYKEPSAQTLPTPMGVDLQSSADDNITLGYSTPGFTRMSFDENNNNSTKADYCARTNKAYKKHLDVLHAIDVAPPLAPALRKKNRILCMVTSISTPDHDRKARAAKDTWGAQCDGWVVISNVTDPTLGAIDIPLEAYDHQHLWEKTRKGLDYVWKHFGDQFEWFYKVDDDAFVVMNNLHQLLASPELQAYQAAQTPIQVGHVFNLPQGYIDAYLRRDPKRIEDFRSKFGTWFYNSGGSGYVMNRPFLQTFVEKAQNQKTCWPPKGKSHHTVPEDAAISFCMAYNGGVVVHTRDKAHRERFHWDNPDRAFHLGPRNEDSFQRKWHDRAGGYQTGKDAVSHEAIAFHYMKPEAQYYAAEQLYYCRNSQWASVSQFNAETPMHLPEQEKN